MKVLNIYISSTIEDSLENRVSAPLPLLFAAKVNTLRLRVFYFYRKKYFEEQIANSKKYLAKKWIMSPQTYSSCIYQFLIPLHSMTPSILPCD